MASVLEVAKFVLNVVLGYLFAFYRSIIPAARKDVTGKIVLITGAGRGIGKCLAEQFAKLGAKVVLVDINEEEARNTAKVICSLGGDAHAYKCDVSKSSDVREMAEKVRFQVGHPDIIVNNAGLSILKEMLELTEEDLHKSLTINVLSNFWMNKQFLPSMLERNDGHIVTVASLSGKTTTPYSTAYSASKFACVGFAESLSEEIRLVHKKPGVQTSIVFPMMVNTEPVKNMSQRFHFNNGFPVMEPEDVAASVVDGVLRNKREIYVPRAGGTIELFRTLVPRQVRETFLDFTGMGIFELNK